MNILLLYNSTQTYTNTVHEHLESFRKYSRNRFFYCHADEISSLQIDLGLFDAIGIHFTIRLPFDQISPAVEHCLSNYNGIKFLFIQDEYDYTQRAWYWINKLKINLVFTVVPEKSIQTVYPKELFYQTRFVSNLTGYVPENLPKVGEILPPSKRSIMIGYRGRPLPVRYGKLGFEKIEIGRVVKQYCFDHSISCEIEWTEKDRIYGTKWYQFVSSCRSMLGSESGSNIFDWDGTLNENIDQYRRKCGKVTDEALYRDLIEPKELNGLMNQISPKVFEAIAMKTVMVLFEGYYSNVVKPGIHYISVKKDFSNLQEVIEQIQDDDIVDKIANQAWQDVIYSNKYSYKSFIDFVDMEIAKSASELNNKIIACSGDLYDPIDAKQLTYISSRPHREPPPQPSIETYIQSDITISFYKRICKVMVHNVWSILPKILKTRIKLVVKRYVNLMVLLIV